MGDQPLGTSNRREKRGERQREIEAEKQGDERGERERRKTGDSQRPPFKRDCSSLVCLRAQPVRIPRPGQNRCLNSNKRLAVNHSLIYLYVYTLNVCFPYLFTHASKPLKYWSFSRIKDKEADQIPHSWQVNFYRKPIFSIVNSSLNSSEVAMCSVYTVCSER